MEKLVINENRSLFYEVISDSFANLDNALDIWIKFTKYLRPDEIDFLEKLKDKKLDSISQDEMDEYSGIKKQLTISKLLLKYKDKKCSREEHDQVVEFMHTSLKSFVKSRLTDEEIELATKYISKLEREEKLKDYIETKQEKYESLNVYDAYILFMSKERLYSLESKKTSEKIRSNQVERTSNLRKNLIRDWGINHKY